MTHAIRTEHTERYVRVHCPDCGWYYQRIGEFTPPDRAAAAKAAGKRHAARHGHVVEVEAPLVIVYRPV